MAAFCAVTAIRQGVREAKTRYRAGRLFLRAKARPTLINELIFDIGLHKGLDAHYYLKKGFRVLGLEASPDLCEQATALNESYVANGRLIIVPKALHTQSGTTVDFFINPEKDDWGSLFQGAAEKGVGTSIRTEVETVTLDDLLGTFGVPYYIKCDIEGGDAIFVEQLLASGVRPTFVSIEATSLDDLVKLRACGYDRFQLVNQYTNTWTKAPMPSREGSYVEQAFTHEMSGLFGHELNPNKWKEFTPILKMFIDYYDLKMRDPDLALGWVDVHASHAETLRA